MNDALPKVMMDELAACPRNDCRVRYARGDTGCNIASISALLECSTCAQIWELEGKGGVFTHWDKSGRPHVTATTYAIGSKWPKGEAQCESICDGWAMKKRFVNADRG